MSLDKEFLNHPRHDYIRFYEEDHTYLFFPEGDFRKTKSAEEFQGITSWIGSYQRDKFDPEKMAAQCNANPNSKYYGWGEEKIKQHWRDKRDAGTGVHKAIEENVNSDIYDEDYAPYIDAFWELMESKDIEPIVSEITLYDENKSRATNVDLIGVRAGSLIPVDFKVYDDGMTYAGYNGKKFLAPIHGIEDSKYNKVSLQTSIPSKWLRDLYEMPVGESYCLLFSNAGPSLLPLLDYSHKVNEIYEWEDE